MKAKIIEGVLSHPLRHVMSQETPRTLARQTGETPWGPEESPLQEPAQEHTNSCSYFNPPEEHAGPGTK